MAKLPHNSKLNKTWRLVKKIQHLKFKI